MKMRVLLPKQQYALLLNRKCSRLERAKHSSQAKDFDQQVEKNEALQEELSAETLQLDKILGFIKLQAPFLTDTFTEELSKIQTDF